MQDIRPYHVIHMDARDNSTALIKDERYILNILAKYYYNNLRNYDTENDENCQNFTLFNSNWKGYEIFLIVTKIKHWFCCDVPFF